MVIARSYMISERLSVRLSVGNQRMDREVRGRASDITEGSGEDAGVGNGGRMDGFVPQSTQLPDPGGRIVLKFTEMAFSSSTVLQGFQEIL